ncbi:MAG: helix-turn-helix domain-containing protein [Leptolinea sp.]|nr:helix-turn-helix domain-containing protein [Leptolinea sp.]
MALKTQIKTLRAHKLAALLVDARLYARRTPEEACALLGWDIEHLEDLEIAAVPPTLPEMEALAAIYAVPVDHFFGNTSLSDGMPQLRTETMTQRLELRNRILGAMIMQARLRRNFSRDDLSYATNIPLEQLIEYELGQEPIPVTDLEDITRMMQIDIIDWIDSYAIPTRDMIFRPYKIGDLPSSTDSPAEIQPEDAVKEQVKTPDQPCEEKLVPEVQVVINEVRPAEIPAPIIPEPQPTPPQPALDVSKEDKTVNTEPAKQESAVVDQKETTEIASVPPELEVLAKAELSKELVDFISNPINREYLLLANNLSRMPADQLRRIAESLLEITY